MSRACRYWGVSRQAYYQQQLQHECRRERAHAVIELVQCVRLRQPRIGTRKLHHLLKQPLEQAQAGLGRDALFDVLRQARLLVAPRRAYHKTTNSHHRFRRHPNLLKAGGEHVQAHAAEQVWVADITYLPTHTLTFAPSLRTHTHLHSRLSLVTYSSLTRHSLVTHLTHSRA